MAPACILSGAPQSFAIPLRDSTPLHDVRGYTAPLRELEAIARHLVGAAYGGTQQIVGAAIVEEPLEGATRWWLVLTRGCETKAAHVKQWLRKRLPPECHLDVEHVETLTPFMQRRLGWGDARTTAELLEALRRESALPPARGDDLLDARLELAAEELNLRVPAATREFDHPVMATSLGRKAIEWSKLGDHNLLRKVSAVKDTLAVPSLAMVRQTALPPSFPSNRDTDIWFPVAQALPVMDLLPLRATGALVRISVYFARPTCSWPKSRRSGTFATW